MDRPVVEAQGDHAPALAAFHDQVDGEIFDEEVGVIFERLLVERVEHGVAGAVRRRRRALGRRPRAHVLHHPAERALVDLALGGAREGHPGMLELIDRRRRLPAQIFDRVLVAQPVRALHGVVHVPGPMVRPHVPERRRDPALSGDGVAAGREHLGDARRPQPRPGRPHRRPKPRPAGADDDDVVTVVDDLVGGAGHAGARGWWEGLRALLGFGRGVARVGGLPGLPGVDHPAGPVGIDGEPVYIFPELSPAADNAPVTIQPHPCIG